jgi:hypothetical protein
MQSPIQGLHHKELHPLNVPCFKHILRIANLSYMYPILAKLIEGSSNNYRSYNVVTSASPEGLQEEGPRSPPS